MKSVEPPTQIPRFFLVTDRSPTQQQEQTARQRKLLLIALLLTSSLFTVVLTNLSHLGELLAGKPLYSHQIPSVTLPLQPAPAQTAPSQAAPVIVQIQRPDGTPHLTLKVITGPAQPTNAAESLPSAYPETSTIILNAVPQSAELTQLNIKQSNADRCPIN